MSQAENLSMFVCFNATTPVSMPTGDPAVATANGAEFASLLAALLTGESVAQGEIANEEVVPESTEAEPAAVEESVDEAEQPERAELEVADVEGLENLPVPSMPEQLPSPEKTPPRQLMPEATIDAAEGLTNEQPAVEGLPSDPTISAPINNDSEATATEALTDTAPVEIVEKAPITDSKAAVSIDFSMIAGPVSQMREPTAPRQIFHAVGVADLNDKVMVAIRSETDGTTELVLSPDELGKVSVKVTTQEQGVHVLVTTERPEAEGLVRRQIETLAQDLKNQGFSNIAFEFGSRSQGHPQSASPDTLVVAMSEETDIPPMPTRSAPMVDGRIDIRV